EVFLGTADEVDPVAVLEVVPEVEVDAGRIPNEDGFPSPGDPQADALGAGALESAHVVLFAAMNLVAEREMAQQVAAKVEQVEVTGRIARVLALVGAPRRVVAGVGDPMAVAGQDLEAGQLADPGQGIRQERRGVLEE